MRLVSLHIVNYGKLENFHLNFNEGLNAFKEDNGVGKSTIVSFIKALLYGLESDNKKTVFTERRHFLPFGALSFQGSLTLESNGHIYRIERIFDKKSETKDVLKIYEDNKLLTNPKECNFLKISKESYEKLITISHEDIDIKSSGDITSKINGSHYDLFDSLDIDELTKEIKAALKPLNSSYKTLSNEISFTKNEINKYKMQISSLDELYGQYKNEDEYNKNLKASYSNYKVSYKFDLLKDKEKELNEKELKLELMKGKYNFEVLSLQKVNELLLLNEMIKNVRSVNIEPSSDSSNKGIIRFLLLLVSIVLLGVGIFLIKVNAYLGLLISFIAFLSSIYFGFRIFKKPSREAFLLEKKNENEEMHKKIFLDAGLDPECDLNEVRSALFSYELLNKEISKLKEEVNELKEELKEVPKLDYDLPNELNKSNERLIELRKDIEDLEDVKDEIEELEIKLEKLLVSKSEIEEKIELYKSLEEEILLAYKNIKEKFINPVKEEYLKYQSYFADKLNLEIEMDNDYKISFVEDGMLRDYRHLSSGKLALLAFCYRLALISKMFKEETPFLIMDDPFVHLDSKSLNLASELIQNLAKEKQVIYFTCHESRMIS